jgi:Domain of unknown function (DUF1508)
LGSNGLTTSAGGKTARRQIFPGYVAMQAVSVEKTSRVVHLKAPNGEIIAASQGYETKANAEKGIEAISLDRRSRGRPGSTSAAQLSIRAQS